MCETGCVVGLVEVVSIGIGRVACGVGMEEPNGSVVVEIYG